MQQKFFDSHAHLTFKTVYCKADKFLENALQANVDKIVNICTDKISLERGLALSARYPWVYTAGATTPHDVEREGELYFPLFQQMAREKKLIAIGETGLDYHYNFSKVELQKHFLQRYFQLAKETSLPVIIHCREAFEDLFAIAESEYSQNGQLLPAVLHCFTGSLDEAQKSIDRGWYISFSGILTFKKCLELRAIAKEIPLKNILIETDTPYLAPQSKRGKENQPAFVVETAKVLADIKDLTLEEVAKETYANACRFFSIQFS